MNLRYVAMLCLIWGISGCATGPLYQLRISDEIKTNSSNIDGITIIQPIIKIQKIPGNVNDNYYSAYDSIGLVNKQINLYLHKAFPLQFSEERKSHLPDTLERKVDLYFGKLEMPGPITDVSEVKIDDKIIEYLSTKFGRYFLIVMQKGFVRSDENVKRTYAQKCVSTIFVALIDKERKHTLYYNQASSYRDPFSEDAVRTMVEEMLTGLLKLRLRNE